MMDPIQCGAGLERGHVVGSDLAQFAVGGHDGTLAPAGDEAFLRHCWTRSLIANGSHLSVSIIAVEWDIKGIGQSRWAGMRFPLYFRVAGGSRLPLCRRGEWETVTDFVVRWMQAEETYLYSK